jgi:hypothetical protein
MKHIQNNQKKFRGKSIPANGFYKSQKKIRETKAFRSLPNVRDFQKMFNRVYRLEIQSVILVFWTPLVI